MDINTVVVTGAGSGIGRSIAMNLAAHGWLVVASDVNLTSAQQTVASLSAHQTASHEAVELNASDPEAADRVATDVSARLGLNAWVNNAGVSAMAKFIDITPADLDRTIDTNLKGVFVCGQAAARAMIRAGRGGRIINIASMAGKQGRVPYLAHYVASKFGVVGLTQAMALELGPLDIRVNAICPGYVRTPMQARELVWEAGLRGMQTSEVEELMVADTPLGRLETPEDVAQVVRFLLSEEASFLTGEAISVNGGAFMD